MPRIPGGCETPETRVSACCWRTSRCHRLPPRWLPGVSQSDADRGGRVFNDQRTAPRPQCLSTPPDDSYAPGCHGRPAAVGRRDRPSDSRDPPGAADLAQAPGVPGPSGAPTAPGWRRCGSSSPPRPRSGPLHPAGSPHLTRLLRSLRRSYPPSRRARGSRQPTAAPGDAARRPRYADWQWALAHAAGGVVPHLPLAASAAGL
jgi:hypothetical protein